MPSREQVKAWRVIADAAVRAHREHGKPVDLVMCGNVVPALCGMIERAMCELATAATVYGAVGRGGEELICEWRGEAAGVLDPSEGSSLLDAAGDQ